MRLFHPEIGYITIGYLGYVDSWGIAWGWKPVQAREPREPWEHQFAKFGWWAAVSYTAWQDFGWLALWPINFCRAGFGPWDPDVYNHETGEHKPYVSSSRWTGRPYRICGVVAFGHYWALKA